MYGTHKCDKNVCFAIVYGAGHMVKNVKFKIKISGPTRLTTQWI